MIERYLAIQKMRFGERLERVIEVESCLEHVRLPCMLLQPLVENAVVHAVEPLTRPVTIYVRAWLEAERMWLEVADDGVGMAPDLVQALNSRCFPGQTGRRPSLGFQSVIQRLEGEYEAQFTFKIESKPDHGARILLSLPIGSRPYSRLSQIGPELTATQIPNTWEQVISLTKSMELKNQPPLSCSTCPYDVFNCGGQCLSRTD
jgi:LytS/YehU family sensor histidine kinase